MRSMLAIFCLLPSAVLAAAIVAVPHEAPRPELQYGLPRSLLLERTGYIAEYAGDRRTARWVIQYFDRERTGGPIVDRKYDFVIDHQLPVEFRATAADYRGSGYQRGHLAPAADCRFDIAAFRSSYLYSNAAPQFQSFNDGIWKRLEADIRSLVGTSYKRAWVVTAPLYLGPQQQFAGRVAVPTHFGKCVLWQNSYNTDTEEGHDATAWILPHTDRDWSKAELDDYRVSVDRFEALTGLDVFAELDDKWEAQLEGRQP